MWSFVAISGGPRRMTLPNSPPLSDQHAALAGLFEDAQNRLWRRLLRLAILDALDRLHQSHAADVADLRVLLHQHRKPLARERQS